ncbi:hypothetical protein D3P07_25345 [Paenibacillus sp. 1011MAR3C5]|uniref:hypothetical protein n=1 Tax=Paenibacillus sp. 1011MAR3C5 TaxID=1675787 RepID=UPI000E6B7701|nr:hypothetical protein [Paenibacillus sp. 1011MAR3C5]RJE83293.1 hypothetical protein D3P07_25345 [Paenibacillus sp. 1011MAR3C5]
MLKTKITLCAILSLSLIGLSAIAHHHIRKDHDSYSMHPPVQEGSYRIYDDYNSSRDGTIYTPYQPREYVRIVKRSVPQ